MELQFTPIPLQFGFCDSSSHSRRIDLPGLLLPTRDQTFGDNDAMSGAQGDSTVWDSGHNDMSSGYNERLQANLFRHGDEHLLAEVLNKSLKDNRKLLPASLRQALMSVARATTTGVYQQ